MTVENSLSLGTVVIPKSGRITPVWLVQGRVGVRGTRVSAAVRSRCSRPEPRLTDSEYRAAKGTSVPQSVTEAELTASTAGRAIIPPFYDMNSVSGAV